MPIATQLNHRRLQAAITATLIGLAIHSNAFAVEPPVAPDSGNILQQLKPNVPPAPASPTTGLHIERQDNPELQTGEAFRLTSVSITGNSRFSTSVLHALVADAEGRTLNLAQLNALADRLSDFYHSHRYPLARAIIPAQTIKDGVVVIQVLEAHYGKISLDNESRVGNPLLNSTLSMLMHGDLIEESKLNHVLLLLSDVPKISVNAVLKPGDNVGTADLTVTTLSGPAFTGIATVDDYGNRYTGRTRGGATLSLVDPFGHGDVLSLSALTSGEDLNYGRLSYESTVNGQGLRTGASFSGLHYKLGNGLQDLQGDGTATDASAWVRQPLVRTMNGNLSGQLQYDRSKLNDELHTQSLQTARHLDTFSLGLSGDLRDGFMAGGVNTGNLNVATGRLNFDNSAAEMLDAATAATQGRFTKLNLNVARMQMLSAADGVYVSLAGQWTNDNLDSSQQMVAGGPYTVRSYDLGVLSGDTGALGTVEFQHDLGSLWEGRWQAAAFLDEQHIVINKNPYTTGPNSATLRGAGASLSWSGPHLWSARASLAARFGAVPSIAPDSSSIRAWVELNRQF